MNLAFQILAALVVGVCYYMLAVLFTVYDGVLTIIFQPIVGAIFTSLAIILVSLLGLPIRLIRPLNHWWRQYRWIPLVLGTIAFCMTLASWLPQFRTTVFDPELQMEVESFHPLLACGGWLLTIFSVLHLYPPIAEFEKREQLRGQL